MNCDQLEKINEITVFARKTEAELTERLKNRKIEDPKRRATILAVPQST